MYTRQNKTQNSAAKKIIIIASCFLLFALSGCIRITVPSRSDKPTKVIKRTFKVEDLIAKLSEYKSYSFKVTKTYYDANGNNPEFALEYKITYSGDLNILKESRKIGSVNDSPVILYIHPDEKVYYVYDSFLNKYHETPLTEIVEGYDLMEQYNKYKNLHAMLRLPEDPEEFNYILLSENEEINGEPCVLVDTYYYSERKMYISKNTGFPLRMEFSDNTVVTITDIEIDNISDTDFDVPAGAEYDPDTYISGAELVKAPF